MNKGQNVRRGRTRHTPNKGGGSSNNGTGNRVDSKSRGNPKQNLEKYLGMARDARQAGDRINEEYFLQFAEHFQRIINDRAQDNEDRRERSGNSNRKGRHQQHKGHNGKNGAETQPADPSQTEQPQSVDPNGEQPAALTTDVAAAEEAPKAPPRKRQPRAKKADKAADESPKGSPEKEAAPASPELPLSKEGEAAE